MALERMIEEGIRSDGEFSDNELDELAFIPRYGNNDAGLKVEFELAKEALERDRELEEFSIVDQSQFRNTEVGKGYHHKGVIRQRTAETAGESTGRKVKDMTQPKPEESVGGKRKHQDAQVQLPEVPPTVEAARQALQHLRNILEQKLKARATAWVHRTLCPRK